MPTETMTAAQYRREQGLDGPAVAKPPRQQRETILHEQVVAWLRECKITDEGSPVAWSHLGNERINLVERLHQHRMGVRAGIPDLLFWRADGRVVNVELKTADGRLSKEQREFYDAIDALGHSYSVARSIDELHTILLREELEIVESRLAVALRGAA